MGDPEKLPSPSSLPILESADSFTEDGLSFPREVFVVDGDGDLFSAYLFLFIADFITLKMGLDLLNLVTTGAFRAS